MTDRLEQLVRDAGDWPVGELDLAAVAARARQRRNRRRGVAMSTIVVVLALVVGITAVVWPDQSDRTVVSTTGRAPDVTWIPVSLPAGAGAGVSGPRVAGGSQGLIAIGQTGTQDPPTAPPPVPTIWRSTDGGATWSVAYTDAVVVPADEKGFSQIQEATFGAAYYLNGMFVVTGDVKVQGPPTSTVAAIWTSPDSITWTQSDTAPFRSPVNAKASNAESRILTATAWLGRLVAVGDLYVGAPKKQQCCGLGVGVWTSRDGITWTRRIADLGDGFDPYITSLTTRGPALVGGGSIDIWTGTVWTTRDLSTWVRSTIADDGRGQVFGLGHGYIAIGFRYTGPKTRDKKKPVAPADNTGIPTIWWSRDARTWEPVLTLAEGSAKDTGDSNAPSFSGGAAVPGLAIANGPPTRSNSAVQLYATANGRSWKPLAVPGETQDSQLATIGTDATGIYVSPNPTTTPNRLTSPATAWRVAPNRSSPPPDVTVTALPTLKFDATTYNAPAGDVRLAFASAGGTHALRFDNGSKHLRRVRMNAMDSDAEPLVKTVHLKRGSYTIYCAIPGHRGAGMQATIVVE